MGDKKVAQLRDSITQSFTNVKQDVLSLNQALEQVQHSLYSIKSEFAVFAKNNSSKKENFELEKKVELVQSECIELARVQTYLLDKFATFHDVQSELVKGMKVQQESLIVLTEQLQGLQESRAESLQEKEPLENTPVVKDQTNIASFTSHDETTSRKVSVTENELAKSLSSSEKSVLLLLVSNDKPLSYRDVALQYGKSPSTIKNIVCRLRNKGVNLHETVASDGTKRYLLDRQIKELFLTSKAQD